MKNRLIIGIILFTFLTTINFKQEKIISKFDIKEINVEKNFLIKEQEIKQLLSPIYNKNLLFLKNKEIETLLMQNDLIESFNIKKKYPNSLLIRIFEKKPILILYNKTNKFYLSDKIEIIKFKPIHGYKNLPYVFGNKEQFKIFYNNLKKINFPFDLIIKYTLYESNRWDLETKNKKIIKLPRRGYTESLKNFLDLSVKESYKNFDTFDFRIKDQLILK